MWVLGKTLLELASAFDSARRYKAALDSCIMIYLWHPPLQTHHTVERLLFDTTNLHDYMVSGLESVACSVTTYREPRESECYAIRLQALPYQHRFCYSPFFLASDLKQR